MVLLVLAAAAVVVSSTDEAATTVDDLQRAFGQPPDDSRIMMRWWWFGPAVTTPQLARELRAMKEAGIGGVEVQPVYPVALDDEARGVRNLPFLSDEFLGALRFASDTAHELGMRMDLTLGSGWPYGGPQIPIAQAAGRLRVEKVAIAPGVTHVALPDMAAGEQIVAIVAARFAGEAIVPDSTREIPIANVRDGLVGVSGIEARELLVFIASRTGMMVKRASVGAEGYVLDHYDRGALDRYLAQVGDPLLRGFGPRPPFAIFCDSLEVFQSDWTGDLLREFQQRRGYDLRPHLPALAADAGPATAAIRHDWGQTLTELANERFLAPLHDWARQHGTRLRLQGYGMPPAALSSNTHADLPEGEGWQWRTLTATRWASSASHLYGRPVTSSETWTWLHSPSFRATPLDMKAEADMHFLQGVTQVIGHGWPYTAEGVAYPGWRFYAAGAFNDKNPWWIVMPDLARYLQRVSFVLRQGAPVNDVAIYLPTSDAWSHFSAGRVHLIETLRELVGPELVGRVLDAGFTFDFIDDEALRAATTPEAAGAETNAGVPTSEAMRADMDRGGALAIGGNRYRAVILPGVERLPLETVRTLDRFARAGGTLIASRRLPSIAPGFRATDADHAQVRDTVRRLFQDANAPARFVEDEAQLATVLTTRLRPDVQLSTSPAPVEPAAQAATGSASSVASRADIGFLHRQTPFADIYFLANTSNRRTSVQATFRATHAHAEWWDPMTGNVTPAVVARATNTRSPNADSTNADSTNAGAANAEPSRTNAADAGASRASSPNGRSLSPGSSKVAGLSTTFELEPYESRVLVFVERAGTRATMPRAPSPSATTTRAASTSDLDLTSDWTVTFGGADASSARKTTMSRLRSWTDDEETRGYSGTATYEKSVTIDAAMIAAGRSLWLDFGQPTPVDPPQGKAVRQRAWIEGPVREAAVVFVNDRRIGSVWHPPYALDITRAVTPGENRLRIIVGNLAINHMAVRLLPSYRLLNLRYGVRFEPQDMDNLQPLPAGLLGNVRLRSMASMASTSQSSPRTRPAAASSR